MKQLITLVILTFVLGMFLPGCGISIEKRQHTGGYYVNVNPRKHLEKHNHPATLRPEASEITEATGTEPAVAPAEEPEQLTAENNAVPEPVIPAVAAEQPNVRGTYRDAATAYEQTAVQQTEKPSVFRKVSDRLPVKGLKVKNTQAGAGASADALSLFWIVILILVILWAAGLISGGWGLGGLINLLLVIALVLLILWLLRII